MWNKISSNHILERRAKQQAYYKHQKALKRIKSQVNNSEPRQYSFLESRSKAKQILNQKNTQIDRNNELLIKKMIQTQSLVSHISQIYLKDSLNAQYTRKIEKRIDHENQNIVQRLQSASSSYSQKNFERSLKIRQKPKTLKAKTSQGHSQMNDSVFRRQSLDQGKRLIPRPYSAIK